MGNLGKMALSEQTKRFKGQNNSQSKLLVQNTDEDHEILSQLGLSDNDLDAKLESLGEYKRISKYSDQWGYCVSRDVLENIAYEYDLTLGESKYYKYSVPVTITADIKAWTKKTGVTMDESYSFYILAPSESFYTKEEYSKRKNKQKMGKADVDPMLVYEIAGSSASGGSVYSLITEWGKDLNPLRKIKAFFINRIKTFTILGILSTIFLLTTIVYQTINYMTLGFEGNDWVTIIIGFMTLIGSTVILVPLFGAINGTNIKRKNFDVTKLERNFDYITIGSDDNYNNEFRFSSFFGEIVARSLIVGVVMSIFFFIFFISRDDGTSFAQDLGYSNWYFTIPMGLVIVTFITALISDMLDYLDWS